MTTDDKDAEIARLQAFVLQLAEHLAICSEELSRCAEHERKHPMPREHDTPAREFDSEVQRRAVDKLRQDNKIMHDALQNICIEWVINAPSFDLYKLAAVALAGCLGPLTDADAVLGGEPRVEAESVPTPDWPERTPFVIGVEQLDAIKAGDGAERHGRTPTVDELAELEAGE